MTSINIESVDCFGDNGILCLMEILSPFDTWSVDRMDFFWREKENDIKGNSLTDFSVGTLMENNLKNSYVDLFFKEANKWIIELLQVILPPSEHGTVKNVELDNEQITSATPEQIKSLWNRTTHAWWLGVKFHMQLCGTWSPHQQLYQETFGSISSAVCSGERYFNEIMLSRVKLHLL